MGPKKLGRGRGKEKRGSSALTSTVDTGFSGLPPPPATTIAMMHERRKARASDAFFRHSPVHPPPLLSTTQAVVRTPPTPKLTEGVYDPQPAPHAPNPPTPTTTLPQRTSRARDALARRAVTLPVGSAFSRIPPGGSPAPKGCSSSTRCVTDNKWKDAPSRAGLNELFPFFFLKQDGGRVRHRS